MSVVVIGSVGYDTIETPWGSARDVLGGSATYFAIAARFFTPVSLVAVVGSDFQPHDYGLFAERGIDLRSLKRLEGSTMRWRGRYHENVNRRDTLELALNVFSEFKPELTADQRRADYVFLANIAPALQEAVLAQLNNPRLIAADTMNHWIANEREGLTRLLPRIDLFMLNEEEVCQLTGEHNLVKAGRAALRMGARRVLIKRGEYGVLEMSDQTMFAVSAYPLEEVVDPTGAGDSFAGGVIGYLARCGAKGDAMLRPAIVYGEVMASFAVERFSVEGLVRLAWEEVDQRYRTFIELTDPRHSRWTSP